MSSASTVEKYMQAMAEGFQSSRARGLEVIHEFRLTGAGGGTWTISVMDGKCDVDQGTPPRADTMVTMGTAQYLKLAAGELDAVDAYNKGQIKVSGSLDHARKFIELFPPWASRVAPDVQPEPAQPTLADYVRATSKGFRPDRAEFAETSPGPELAPTPSPQPTPTPKPSPTPSPSGPLNPTLRNGSFDDYQPFIRDGDSKVWKEPQFDV